MQPEIASKNGQSASTVIMQHREFTIKCQQVALEMELLHNALLNGVTFLLKIHLDSLATNIQPKCEFFAPSCSPHCFVLFLDIHLTSQTTYHIYMKF